MLPVFLLWLFLVWVIVLVGAIFVLSTDCIRPKERF